MNGLDLHYGTIKLIADDMGKLNLRPSIDVGHAGHRFDIIADAPDGRSVAVELKHWDAPTKGMLAKAEREAELLSVKGALDCAYVVIPHLADSEQTDRVRNLAGLRKSLTGMTNFEVGDVKRKIYLGEYKADGVKRTINVGRDKGVVGDATFDIANFTHYIENFRFNDTSIMDLTPRGGVASGKAAPRDVFVAMPFASLFEDTFFQAIEPAADKAGAACNRVDVQYVSGQILDLIHAGIRKCDLVVADLSEGNANVTYELGYAHALEKPVIHISSTPSDALPFDLRQWQTIKYNLGQTHLLKKELQKVIPQMFAAQPDAT